MGSLRRTLLDCAEAAFGMHGTIDREGRCPYCRRRIELATPRPLRTGVDTTELNDAYRYHFDPDWGGGRWDT